LPAGRFLGSIGPKEKKRKEKKQEGTYVAIALRVKMKASRNYRGQYVTDGRTIELSTHVTDVRLTRFNPER
jgi:hypothetical protein